MTWLVRAALGSAFGLLAVMLALSGSVMIYREFFAEYRDAARGVYASVGLLFLLLALLAANLSAAVLGANRQQRRWIVLLLCGVALVAAPYPIVLGPLGFIMYVPSLALLGLALRALVHPASCVRSR